MLINLTGAQSNYCYQSVQKLKYFREKLLTNEDNYKKQRQVTKRENIGLVIAGFCQLCTFWRTLETLFLK